MKKTDIVADGKSVSRRTLVAGAAWAVPTVATLSAAPAMAASTGQVSITAVAASCTGLNNGTETKWIITFSNTSTSASTVSLTSVGGVNAYVTSGSTGSAHPSISVPGSGSGGTAQMTAYTATHPGASPRTFLFTVDGVDDSESHTYTGQTTCEQ